MLEERPGAKKKKKKKPRMAVEGERERGWMLQATGSINDFECCVLVEIYAL